MTDDLTARIQALVVDPLAPLDPPAGLDLTITWHIPVGTITRTVHSDTENEINQARLRDGLFVSAEDIARETTAVTMVCPLCGAADRLAIVGRWGHPARFSCGCGHQWQPYPRNPQWGIRSMMDAITTAVQHEGLPT